MGVPRQVTAIVDADHGIVEVDVEGQPSKVSAALLLAEGRPAEIGDWVDVHLGIAHEHLTAEEAAEARRWLDELMTVQQSMFGISDE